MMFPRIALAAAIALAPLTAQALDLSSMTETEREAFRAEIRAYLLENPEVLMEAIGVLEERQQAEQAEAEVAMLEANSADLFDFSGDWVGGNPDGDITLVEFLDYRCGYCRRAFPEVMELVEGDGNIRLIVKEFPILGEQSLLSSRFAIAVRQVAGDKAYKVAHDTLMNLRGDLNEAAMAEIAAEVGADMESIAVQMESPEVDAVIAHNRGLAQRLQINGTPSFVLGGTLLRGYLPLDSMRALVDETRSEG